VPNGPEASCRTFVPVGYPVEIASKSERAKAAKALEKSHRFLYKQHSDSIA
jgi:hypothetical protein